MSENNVYKTIKIYALAKDPIYIGTGGYKIGRVDNTIVRDPSTNEPKIPGSSLAGVWRYYSVLSIYENLKEDFRADKKIRKNKKILELFNTNFEVLNKVLKNIKETIIKEIKGKPEIERFFDAFLPYFLNALFKVYEEDYVYFGSTEDSNMREENFKTHLFCEIKNFIKCEENRGVVLGTPISVDTELEKNMGSNRIRPDIVIHKRGTHNLNLVVIEIKRNRFTLSDEEIVKDFDKLKSFKNKLLYVLPVFVGVEIEKEKIKRLLSGTNGYKEILIILLNRKENKDIELTLLINGKEKNLLKSQVIPNWILFEGNKFIGIKCAGQDDAPNVEIENEQNTGHCGRCIVCKSFGFSKKDISWQGLIFFSDLEILFFPVFTYKGTKWITTLNKLKRAGLEQNNDEKGNNEVIVVFSKNNKYNENINGEKYINLGWLYLPYEVKNMKIDLNKLKFDKFELNPEDIIIVPEELFSQIVNSNLEVRTSVSIDPITGAAKERALFTSEVIPRGTIFFGEIRIFDKKFFENINGKIKPIPKVDQIKKMLEDSAKYFEVLGIGGMTTRGFGRLKIEFDGKNSDGNEQENTSNDDNERNENSNVGNDDNPNNGE